jgi:fluoroacetyl-CoA thioesterase
VREGLAPGMSRSTTEGRETPDSVRRFGGAAPVLLLADIVGTMERTARKWLTEHCEDGEQTVGVRVEVERVDPPVDAQRITATATLRRIDGRRYEFDVSAVNERGDLVATGTHERRLVRLRRYES